MDYNELIGKKGSKQWKVTHEMLASTVKSGTVDVLSTPYMIALMEHTAGELVQPFLPVGISTVGTLLNITHQNPSSEGAVIRAEAEILETDGRRFLFLVTAWDEAGIIGEGTHERFTVKQISLEEKAAARRTVK